MEQNIFQVVDENHLNEILAEHSENLVIIMYSSKTCGPCKTIKPKFISLSRQYPDTFFIYVDRLNYKIVTNKHFNEYQFTPTFLFYIGNSQVAYVEGAHEPALVKTLSILQQKIDEKKKEIIEKEKSIESQKILELEKLKLEAMGNNKPKGIKNDSMNNQNIENMTKKMDLLNKLRELAQTGVKLTQNYNLDSDFEMMLYEYQFHTNPKFSQSNTDPKPTSEGTIKDDNSQILKNQEKVRQIQELSIISQRMQMQNLQKLQLLKNIQMMREQQEKKESEKKNESVN